MIIGDEEYQKLREEGWRNRFELALSDTPEGHLEFFDLKESYRDEFQTPFDEKLYRGTPHPWDFLNERGHKVEDYHTPKPFLMKRCSIEEAQRMRRKLEYWWASAPHWMGLGDQYIAISFEDLDPETGITVRDPRILGTYDKENGQVVEVVGRDLTKEFYVGFGKREGSPSSPSIWELLRDTKEMLEKEAGTPSQPEKE